MTTLVFNLGNTTLLGGVFKDERLLRSFRFPARSAVTSAGFARPVARELRGAFDVVAVCSVVPRRTGILLRAVRRHTGLVPRLLEAASPHGLKIGYQRPAELGTDRLAAAVGAQSLYPRQNVIVVDSGTATTVTALDWRGTLLGGAILPGLALGAASLATGTAQLPRVAPVRPARALGRGTRGGIESGVFFGHVGAIREVVQRIRAEAFGRGKVVVLGTGGNAPLLGRENLFTRLEPDLILFGLRDFALRNFHHD